MNVKPAVTPLVSTALEGADRRLRHQQRVHRATTGTNQQVAYDTGLSSVAINTGSGH